MGNRKDVRTVVDFPAAMVNLWFQTESLEQRCIGRAEILRYARKAKFSLTQRSIPMEQDANDSPARR